MLTHSPPLPLVIDYQLDEDDDISAEDEEHAILALKQYDRVRRVRFMLPDTSLQKLIVAMDGEYPILEYLIIWHLGEKSSTLMLPETLQAPHLRHLVLFGFSLPIGSRSLTTAVGLVTFVLIMGHPSTYFHPNTLLQWLSFMPQLENLAVGFSLAVPSRDVEKQFTHTPTIMTAVTLPNLRSFGFRGVGTCLEAFLHRITTPRLEKLRIYILNQLTFSVPRLLQFVSTTDNLRFKIAKFTFADTELDLKVYPHEEAKAYALSIFVNSRHLDWQVSSAAQISNSLGPTFSAVENLTLGHSVHNRSSEEHNETDPTDWRKLLISFRNVKTLRIAEGLVKELSRCLELDDGELPSELLPELQELTYVGSGSTGDKFTSFIDARQDAGRSITLIRRSPSPDPTVSSVEPSSITSASGETGSDLAT